MRDVSTPCPLCGAPMEQCDYSPLYGYSWIHPKAETTAICEHSGKLVFSKNKPIQGGTMTDTQLKPCPFCGAAGVKSRQGYYTCSNDHCNLVTMSDGWNYRPIEDALQARIEELELILAADKLIEDGWIGRIEAGDKRIAVLESALDKAAHQLYDYSGSCPSDLYDWEHPNTCIRECDKYDNPDEAWKCWRLWLLEKPKEEQ